MKIIIEFNNVAKCPLAKSFFVTLAGSVLQEADVGFLKNKKVFFSIALVDEEEIKKLNLNYRRKNHPTDCLSFAEFEKTAKIKEVKSTEVYLGELIMCYSDIKKYARKEKKNLKKELAIAAAHGMLHLLGMRHGKKMFALQEKAAKSLI